MTFLGSILLHSHGQILSNQSKQFKVIVKVTDRLLFATVFITGSSFAAAASTVADSSAVASAAKVEAAMAGQNGATSWTFASA
jgi:hypothetical protein